MKTVIQACATVLFCLPTLAIAQSTYTVSGELGDDAGHPFSDGQRPHDAEGEDGEDGACRGSHRVRARSCPQHSPAPRRARRSPPSRP